MHLKSLPQFMRIAALGFALVVTGCAGNRYERSTGESIDDRATTSRVKSALSSDAVYKYPSVNVSTFKGTVQLSGFVNTKEQKDKAKDIAKGVEGVKEVENNISVKP
jgi:osmotically-inducible protein OsmY